MEEGSTGAVSIVALSTTGETWVYTSLSLNFLPSPKFTKDYKT